MMKEPSRAGSDSTTERGTFMVVISRGWDLDVDRGPDWLIVGIRCGHDSEWDNPPLAESIWHLLDQSFTHRVVVDLSGVTMLHTWLIGQLVQLQKRVGAHEGVMRVCGLTDRNRDILRSCRLDGFFPNFHDRNEAVRGCVEAPRRPR
jgi:anti-anti-sigma regulatory factor